MIDMDRPKWETLVAMYGEERALKVLDALEKIYLARHMRLQRNLSPEDRLNRIFGMLIEVMAA